MAKRSPVDELQPRRSPLQSRSAATVNVILEAAARILEERGLEGLNTNAVAARAGVSVGSVYQYYSCKEALIAALIYNVHEIVLSKITDLAAHTQSSDLQTVLTAFIDLACEHHVKRPKLIRILEREEERLPHSVELTSIEQRIHAAAAELLRPHLPTLQENEEELRLVTFDIVNIWQVMTEAAIRRGSRFDARLKDRMLSALCGYLERYMAVT